jgi:hypothetical protein
MWYWFFFRKRNKSKIQEHFIIVTVNGRMFSKNGATRVIIRSVVHVWASEASPRENTAQKEFHDYL